MWFYFLNFICHIEVSTYITTDIFLTLTKGDKQFILFIWEMDSNLSRTQATMNYDIYNRY